MLKSNIDYDYYEELYEDEPSEQKIIRNRRKIKNIDGGSKRNQIDKKNAEKAPWKDESMAHN